jgi:cyclophilin family peptidyl-prolyl cis-trans isomerase
MLGAINISGLQSFICHNRERTKRSDHKHIVFGKVVEGLGIIPKNQARR